MGDYWEGVLVGATAVSLFWWPLMAWCDRMLTVTKIELSNWLESEREGRGDG
jgi:hypothetical protein